MYIDKLVPLAGINNCSSTWLSVLQVLARVKTIKWFNNGRFVGCYTVCLSCSYNWAKKSTNLCFEPNPFIHLVNSKYYWHLHGIICCDLVKYTFLDELHTSLIPVGLRFQHLIPTFNSDIEIVHVAKILLGNLFGTSVDKYYAITNKQAVVATGIHVSSQRYHKYGCIWITLRINLLRVHVWSSPNNILNIPLTYQWYTGMCINT